MATNRLRLCLMVFIACLLVPGGAWAEERLANVSYDVSRSLFDALNLLFLAKWKSETGESVRISQSHGSSSRQVRAILDGQAADVVTLNQETDIDALVAAGFVAPGWRNDFPNGASPYYSFPAFLVRAGNPKNIRDWSDLARADVQPVFPNPKSSGNGRYTYLAAYAFAMEKTGGDQKKTREFVRQILSSVPVFEAGGHLAAQSFVEQGIGDVLVTFEAETRALAETHAEQGFVAITPSVSLLAAFPVAVITAQKARSGSATVSRAYLAWLYSLEAQAVIARNHYRGLDATLAARQSKEIPPPRLLSVDEAFGGWAEIGKTHLAAGGILDQLLADR